MKWSNCSVSTAGADKHGSEVSDFSASEGRRVQPEREDPFGVWELAPAFSRQSVAVKRVIGRGYGNRKSGGEPPHSKMSARRHFRTWQLIFPAPVYS